VAIPGGMVTSMTVSAPPDSSAWSLTSISDPMAHRASPWPAARWMAGLMYAAIGGIQQRLAPLVQVLQQAAAGDVELRALWQAIADRRAANRYQQWLADAWQRLLLRPA
jgi:hypothetical protein